MWIKDPASYYLGKPQRGKSPRQQEARGVKGLTGVRKAGVRPQKGEPIF